MIACDQVDARLADAYVVKEAPAQAGCRKENLMQSAWRWRSMAAWVTGLACGLGQLSPVMAVPLGEITGPAQFTVVGSHGSPFVDHHSFTVAPGLRLSFSAILGTPPSNWFWIDDLDATLWHAGAPLAEADARDRPDSPFPARDVTLAPIELGPGSHDLRVFGTPTTDFPGGPSHYEGVLQFSAIATPVPELGMAALWAWACGAIGAASWLTRRPRRPRRPRRRQPPCPSRAPARPRDAGLPTPAQGRPTTRCFSA